MAYNNNNNNNYEGVVSPQIAVYKTGKKLLEFNNKLVVASPEHYAGLHAADGGAKSCVGMTLLDYSRGTGQNTVSVSVNLSPSQMEWWYTAVLQRHMGFKMEQEKIHSFKSDANGTAPVTKLLVIRNATDNKGQPTRYPWYISVENGTGRVQKNQNGGTSIAPQSYRKESQVFINLNDEDMFRVLYAVHVFTRAWETTFTPDIIRAGIERAKARTAQNTSQKTPSAPQGYAQQPQAPQGYAQQAGNNVPPATQNIPGYTTATQATPLRPFNGWGNENAQPAQPYAALNVPGPSTYA